MAGSQHDSGDQGSFDPTVPRRRRGPSGKSPAPGRSDVPRIPSQPASDGPTAPRRGMRRPSERNDPAEQATEPTVPRRGVRRQSERTPDATPASTTPLRPSGRVSGNRPSRRQVPPAVATATADSLAHSVSLTPAAEMPSLMAASGSSWSRYRLGEQLGRGGIGVVHGAQDPALRREVAIKRLLRADDPAERAGFIEEAQITGQLEHPNIVPVHELGHDEQGRPYLTMKRVQGRTLQDVITDAHRNELTDAEWLKTERRLLDIFGKVCDAIGYAHACGVIHRDIKPENVMVGAFGEVLVMDWGLAKPLGGAERHVTSDRRATAVGSGEQLTMQGDVFGTPAYMPPEQAEGRHNDMDERADIYALGSILYTMLVGKPAFAGRDAQRTLQQVIGGKFRLPSEAGGTRPVARELEAVVLRAMAWEPGDRYAMVTELNADIGAYLDGRTLSAADYSPWQLLKKWAARNKAAVIGGSATAAAVLVGIIAVVWVMASAETQRLLSERAAREQTEATQRSAAIANADKYYADAQALLPATTSVEFNPASPSQWYQAWLPICLRIGQAVQAHPEPPTAWKSELAGYCATIQRNAESIGDWGMAQHIAESVGAWRAVEPAKRDERLQHVEAEKVAMEQADVARLVAVLQAIADAEDRYNDSGEYQRKGRDLYSGEVAERARRLVSRVRGRTSALNGTIIKALRDDPATLGLLGLPAPTERPDVRLRRQLLIEAIGRLADSTSSVGGDTSAILITSALAKPYEVGLEDEMSTWIMSAARIEASRPGTIRAVTGTDLQAILDQWRPHLGFAVSTAESLLTFAKGDHRLPPVKPGAIDGEAFAARMTEIADWSASAARSGSAYTANLLAIHASNAVDLGGACVGLRPRQLEYVINQFGLFGDNQAPGVAARSPTACLHSDLQAVPSSAFADRTSFDPRRVVVALIASLSRLDARESGSLINKQRYASQQHSLVWVRTSLAYALLPLLEEPGDREPMNSSALNDRGSQRAEKGDINGAFADFDRAIQLDPTFAPAFNNRGIARMVNGDVAGAITDYNIAIHLNPNFAKALNNRGFARRAKGDLDGAIADYSTAILLDPAFADALNNRGIARREKGDLNGAIADYDLAIQIHPDYAQALSNRGNARCVLGDLDQAIADYDRAIQLDPTAVEAFNSRAAARQATGDLAGAIADFDRAIQLNPNYASAFCNRGAVKRAVGDWDGSLADYDRAIHLDPKNAEAFTNRGLSRLHKGDFDGAIADHDRAIQLKPDFAGAYFNRGCAKQDKGNLDGAISDYDRAIELDPNNASAFNNRGLARRSKGEMDGAEADFDRAIELDPNHASAFTNRGSARRARGDLDGAILDYDRAIELNQDSAETIVNRGLARVDKGDLEGAVADYDRATHLYPHMWQAWLNRAVATQKTDRAATLHALQQAYAYCDQPAAKQQIAGYIRQLGGAVPE